MLAIAGPSHILKTVPPIVKLRPGAPCAEARTPTTPPGRNLEHATNDRRTGPSQVPLPRGRQSRLRRPRCPAIPRHGRTLRRAGHPLHLQPPRAGLRIHGRRLLQGRRRLRHRPRSPRPRPAQRLRRSRHRLLRILADAPRIRPGRQGPDRKGHRAPSTRSTTR